LWTEVAVLKNNITNNSLCSGCGICSAVCPKDCIKTEENDIGELRPVVNENLCVDCGKCKTVCPFENRMEKYIAPTGNCFIGRAPGFSENASSGGIATYILSKMLTENTVDYIVSVKQGNGSDNLFEYCICETTDELLSCQGSAYYPVTLCSIIKKVKNIEGNVAIIGVPCFVSAINNLRKQSAFWNEKIPYLIGIVCGHTPSKLLVDVLAWKSGHKREDIKSCKFRIKDGSRPAWDYGVRLDFSDKTHITSFGSEDFGFLFWRKLFSQTSCNNCYDVFADDADITFMDAWLDEYKEKNEGTSLVICRNAKIEEWLQKLVDGGYAVEADISKAEMAQKELIEYKKSGGENHKSQEKLKEKIVKCCIDNKEDKNISEKIKRICYKENLKSTNVFLWLLMEIKDRICGK